LRPIWPAVGLLVPCWSDEKLYPSACSHKYSADMRIPSGNECSAWGTPPLDIPLPDVGG
jgi:hypothetical protein